jgi:hypothetical protein
MRDGTGSHDDTRGMPVSIPVGTIHTLLSRIDPLEITIECIIMKMKTNCALYIDETTSLLYTQ